MKYKTIVCIRSDDEYFPPESSEKYYVDSLLIQYGNKIYGSLANAVPHESKKSETYETFKSLFKDLGIKMPDKKPDYPNFEHIVMLLEDNDYRVMTYKASCTGKLEEEAFFPW